MNLERYIFRPDPDLADTEFDWLDDAVDDEPLPPLHLTATQQATLAASVRAEVRELGCDNTLRAARRWTTNAGLNWQRLQAALEGRGAFCDCELVLNADLAT